MACQVVGTSVRLGSLRPRSGPNGGVAARYRVADNTMGVGFVEPAKRIRAPSYQTVRGIAWRLCMWSIVSHQLTCTRTVISWVRHQGARVSNTAMGRKFSAVPVCVGSLT